MEQLKTITLDGETYEVDSLSDGIKQAIFIYNTFNSQLQTQQLEVMKTQAALQQVGQQIAAAIKDEHNKEDPEDLKETDSTED